MSGLGRAARVAAAAILPLACASDSRPTPEQRMQHDLLWLSTREFMSMEASGSFGTPFDRLPPRGEPPSTTLQLLWTGPSGWIARSRIAGHAGDCVMAGGLVPESAFAFTTLRHKGADPEDVVCDNSAGPGTTGWRAYVERYTALPLAHALLFFGRRRREGRAVSADSVLRPGYVSFSGLHRELLWSDDISWAGRTWLGNAPDRSCVAWWGALGTRTPPSTYGGVVARTPERIVCDTALAASVHTSTTRGAR